MVANGSNGYDGHIQGIQKVVMLGNYKTHHTDGHNKQDNTKPEH